MKKILLVVLCVCLCSTIFIGCEKEEEVEPVVTETIVEKQTIELTKANHETYLTVSVLFSDTIQTSETDETYTLTSCGTILISRIGNFNFEDAHGNLNINIVGWSSTRDYEFTLSYDGYVAIPFITYRECSKYYELITSPGTGRVYINNMFGTVIING